MLNGGKLLPEFSHTWAKYYAKFIKAYEAEGMPIWGLPFKMNPWLYNVGNPVFILQLKKGTFLKNYLGPSWKKKD